MRWMVLGAALVALAAPVWADPVRIAFILDASDSMNLPHNGVTKFEFAKDALVQTVEGLPEGTAFAVVVFGHRVVKTSEAASCKDIELLYPLKAYTATERASIVARIKGLVAKGKTPLASSLKFVAGSVPAPARVVLLTDGVETCGGNPEAEARKLAAAGYTVDVVALAVKPEEEKALRAIAAAGKGRFVLVKDPGELAALFRELLGLPTLPPTPPAPTLPTCLTKYKVSTDILQLLVKHLPYPTCDAMWDLILKFLEANPPAKVLVGTDGDDVLFGTSGNDLILALGGKDQIYAFGGNDLVIAGAGDDLVQGGDGDDLILGGAGNDLLLGGTGCDVIYGEEGDDRLEGEAGDDILCGGLGDDLILGGPGCNKIDGGPGKNRVFDEGLCLPCPPPAPVPATKCPTAVPPGQQPPVLAAPKAVKAVNEGECIVLRAEIYDPDGDPVKVTWSAPKGFFTDPNGVETTYFAPWVLPCEGEMVEITVTAEDACGARSVDKLLLHVRNVNRPPVVDAGPDLMVDEGGKVKLMACAADPDSEPLTFLWIVPCGRGSLDNPTALSPVYTAPLTSKCEGEFVELVLKVRDVCGAEVQDTVRVYVRNVNRPPWADAGPDLTVPECGRIAILAKAGDPDGEKLTYSWTASAGLLIGDDTLCPIFVAPEVEGCDHIMVTLVLRVMDPCGAIAEDVLCIKVTNVNRPPQVKADP